MSEIREVLAERIRTEAERRDYGINELADVAGVSRSQLFDILGERKGASVDFIDKLAVVLKVDAHALLRRHAKRRRN